MTPPRNLQAIDLAAFRAALAACSARGIELPEAIMAIAPDLESHIHELDELSEQDKTFEAFYQAERLAIQNQDAQRNKRLYRATTILEDPLVRDRPPQIDPPEVNPLDIPPQAETKAQGAPSPPQIQRFVLPANSSQGDREYFQTYIAELKRLNPQWVVSPAPRQPGEADAYIMICRDQNYALNHAAYLATQILDQAFQTL